MHAFSFLIIMSFKCGLFGLFDVIAKFKSAFFPINLCMNTW